MTHVAVLYGGFSAEREVSLRSGTEVAAALREAGFAVEDVTIDRPGLAELRVQLCLLLFAQRELIAHGSNEVGMQQAAFQPIFDIRGL